MLPETIILETERLLLQEVNPEWYHALLTRCSDEEIMNQLCFDEAGVALARARFAKGMTNYHTTFKYFLMKDKDLRTTLGTCGFYRWYPEHDRAEIGYMMNNEAYREKGLVKEAVHRIVRYGFEDMNVNRIEAYASPANTPSIKILEGLGMKYEGLLRGHYLVNGVYQDSACYGLLRQEYLQNTNQ